MAGKRLDNIAMVLEHTAEQHITADVALDTNLPLNSNFEEADVVAVGIDMLVETAIPIKIEIPVNQDIMAPFKVGVKDFIKLDTTIMITDDVYALVEDTLYLDQKVTMLTSKKRGITVPITASIPLNERVKVSVDQAVPVNTTATVSFPNAIPIVGNIPVSLTIPVDIPLSETDLAPYFIRIAEGLRGLVKK